MNRSLKVATGAFYLLATIVMAATFARDWNGSWLYAGHAVALYGISIVLPALWVRALVAALRARGVPLGDLQLALIVPAWCAVGSALVALQLVSPWLAVAGP